MTGRAAVPCEHPSSSTSRHHTSDVTSPRGSPGGSGCATRSDVATRPTPPRPTPRPDPQTLISLRRQKFCNLARKVPGRTCLRSGPHVKEQHMRVERIRCGCASTRGSFTVLLQERPDGVWEVRGASDGSSRAVDGAAAAISGRWELGPAYGGCPRCSNRTVYICTACGQLNCCGDRLGTPLSCAGCGTTGSLGSPTTTFGGLRSSGRGD